MIVCASGLSYAFPFFKVDVSGVESCRPLNTIITTTKTESECSFETSSTPPPKKKISRHLNHLQF